MVYIDFFYFCHPLTNVLYWFSFRERNLLNQSLNHALRSLRRKLINCTLKRRIRNLLQIMPKPINRELKALWTTWYLIVEMKVGVQKLVKVIDIIWIELHATSSHYVFFFFSPKMEQAVKFLAQWLNFPDQESSMKSQTQTLMFPVRWQRKNWMRMMKFNLLWTIQQEVLRVLGFLFMWIQKHSIITICHTPFAGATKSKLKKISKKNQTSRKRTSTRRKISEQVEGISALSQIALNHCYFLLLFQVYQKSAAFSIDMHLIGFFLYRHYHLLESPILPAAL